MARLPVVNTPSRPFQALSPEQIVNIDADDSLLNFAPDGLVQEQNLFSVSLPSIFPLPPKWKQFVMAFTTPASPERPTSTPLARVITCTLAQLAHRSQPASGSRALSGLSALEDEESITYVSAPLLIVQKRFTSLPISPRSLSLGHHPNAARRRIIRRSSRGAVYEREAQAQGGQPYTTSLKG